jgi:ferric-dicitrate binding protein FerR (iron transport regulator)
MSRTMPFAFVSLAVALAVFSLAYCSSPGRQAHADSHLAARPAHSGAINATVSLQDVTVAEAVRVFNSQNREQLVIADSTIAEKKIGGTFNANDPERFAVALRHVLGVKVVREGEAIRLEREDRSE